MACSQVLIVLVLAVIVAGKPTERQTFEIDVSSHLPEEVPKSSKVDLTEYHGESYRNNHKLHLLQPPAQETLSNDKVHSDFNNILQTTEERSKQTIRSSQERKKPSTDSKKNLKKGKKSNTDLLHHLGMTKLSSPPVNHHRKRLASQSRKTHHQKSNSESKMFVIKLPPNPYYYAHHDLNGYDVIEPKPKSVNNVPVNFKTNGKPSKVYHWNIPMLKKMVARKAGSSAKSTIFADADVFSIDKQATWNETDDDKSMYRKATYYGPKKQSKHTFRKYFSGNGKPHSFYVMEKSKKPASVYRLLP